MWQNCVFLKFDNSVIFQLIYLKYSHNQIKTTIFFRFFTFHFLVCYWCFSLFFLSCLLLAVVFLLLIQYIVTWFFSVVFYCSVCLQYCSSLFCSFFSCFLFTIFSTFWQVTKLQLSWQIEILNRHSFYNPNQLRGHYNQSS